MLTYEMQNIKEEHERKMAGLNKKAEARKPLVDAVAMAAVSGSNDALRTVLEALKANKGL